MNFPALPVNIFLVLTLGLFFLLLGGIKGSLRRARHSNQTGVLYVSAFVIFGYLLGLAFLANQGWFAHFLKLPPRVMLPVALCFIFIAFTAFNKGVGKVLDELPMGLLIYPQVFRIGVEIVLWQLGESGKAPTQMTFEGMNYDILAGISAPIVAFIAFGQGRNIRWLGILWNFLALGLLINILVIAILSLPAIGAFQEENRFIAYFPFIWLPGFVAPMALWLHVMSLRQLFRRKA